MMFIECGTYFNSPFRNKIHKVGLLIIHHLFFRFL
nr:MAG TPA: hypothetical protein [Caudoviricetes sp.]